MRQYEFSPTTLDGANVLITGGTGSFGKRFVSRVLEASKPERLIIFSRDELKQFHMRQQFPLEQFPNVRMLIGDVRDRERLSRVLDGVDVVIHAAALKQVPTAEHNPLEAIKTNIMGAAHLIDAAIDRGVQRVVALSTDKAANPVNLYGATKLCADKLFVAANATSRETRFSVVRYGNVVGSRGSVIPYFLAQRATGRITLTDERMTRFLMTLDQSVDFVLRCVELMLGGELFVPKIPSAKVVDIARVIAPDCEREVIGIRPGEKIHETLVSKDEGVHTYEFHDKFIACPQIVAQKGGINGGVPLGPEFEGYTSDRNKKWLTVAELKKLLNQHDETK